jgi:chemotaxis protein MotB
MKLLVLLAATTSIALSSCVSKKKFINEQSKVSYLQSDSLKTHNSLENCYSNLSDLNQKVSVLENDKNEIQKEMSDLSSSAKTTINNSKMTIAEQAKRLKDLQMLIQSQKDILTNLKKTIADALVNFKPDELSVDLKEGRLYVSLQEKLLFKSGSAVADPKGKEALKSLAIVLNTTQDISVLIEGHTDNVPISGKYQDNWMLSVERSTSIVRILTLEYKVDSKMITAAGRAEFNPVAPNTSLEGKAKNRRIEIILSPNLKDLFTLLNQ